MAQMLGVLSGQPMGMRAEQSIGNANLIRHYEAEAQTQQSRSQCQPTGEIVSAPSKVKAGSNGHGDNHHAGNGAYAKNQ